MSTKYKFKNIAGCYFISFAVVDWVGVFTRKVGESRIDWMLKIFSVANKKNSYNSECQNWRQDNHPIEVWSEDVIHQKLLYLHNNPAMEGFVDNAEEYLLSSARDYYNDKNCGLLEIKFITE